LNATGRRESAVLRAKGDHIKSDHVDLPTRRKSKKGKRKKKKKKKNWEEHAKESSDVGKREKGMGVRRLYVDRSMNKQAGGIKTWAR